MDNTTHGMSEDLLTIFWTEADARLAAITENLRCMQETGTAEAQFSLLGEIFADIQSLRGAAASVDQPDINALAQSLEDVFARLRYDDLRLSADGYEILQRALVTSREVVSNPHGRHAKHVADTVEALAVLSEDGVQSGLLLEAEATTPEPYTLDESTWTIAETPLSHMALEAPPVEGSVPVTLVDAHTPETPSQQEIHARDPEPPLISPSEDEPSPTPPELLPADEVIVSVSHAEAEPPVAEDPVPVVAVTVDPPPVEPPPLVSIQTPPPGQPLISPELMDAVRAAFRGEADEHLESLEAGLLALEKTLPEDEQATVLEYTFRSAHSLKGAARAVGLTDIQSVCQAIENVFAGLKRGELRLSSDGFDVMHQALDAVNALLVDAETPEIQQRVDETIDQLHALVESTLPEGIVIPPAAEPALQVPAASGTVLVDVVVPPGGGQEVPQRAPLRTSRRTSAPSAPTEESPARFTGETIRVATAKLDALLLQAEEMLAVRQAAGERTIELREVLGSLVEWRKEWSKVSSLARKLQRICEGTSEQERQAQPHLSLTHRMLEFLYWNESHFKGLEISLKNVTRAAERDHKQAGTLIGRLLDDTKKVLMLPFASLLNSFPKMVRDLSRTLYKDVELRMQGTEVEIDKRILDAIKDPLIHLLRNCVDHGLEVPAARTVKGKEARGTISIEVSQVGVSKVEIRVADDGAGINRAAVVTAAIRKGILTEQEAEVLDERAALGLIFQSDVSTSETVTDLSGRGLGMAIVRETVERLGGQIWVDTTPGEGTIFRMLLPLTLATFRGFFVEARGSTFVIPTMNVERVVRIRPSEVKLIEDVETVTLNGRPVGVAYLSNVLDIPAQASVENSTGFLRGLVLTSGDRRVLFCVDQVVNEQEVLFKNLGTYLTAVPNVAGVTVLGSGKVVPILDVPNLVRSTIEGTTVRQSARTDIPVRVATKQSVLLAEDSVTSRMLLKGILESAGYEVTTAVDGLEALSQLGRRAFDLVVSDVEMPRMNGFELTAKIRTHEKHLHLPVILVTGLESRADRERGMEAGASAYIVKGDFTQNDLLKTVQRFLPTVVDMAERGTSL